MEDSHKEIPNLLVKIYSEDTSTPQNWLLSHSVD